MCRRRLPKGWILSENPVLLTLDCRERTSLGTWVHTVQALVHQVGGDFASLLDSASRSSWGCMCCQRIDRRAWQGAALAWGVPEPVEGLGLWLLLLFLRLSNGRTLCKGLGRSGQLTFPCAMGWRVTNSVWFVQTVSVEPQTPALVSRLPAWCFPTWLWKVLEEPGIALSTSGNPSGF